jgi:hypothetical protein
MLTIELAAEAALNFGVAPDSGMYVGCWSFWMTCPLVEEGAEPSKVMRAFVVSTEIRNAIAPEGGVIVFVSAVPVDVVCVCADVGTEWSRIKGNLLCG